MNRFTATVPTQYDDLKFISISKLKEWGYLKQGTIQNFEITWSRDGVQTSNIGCYIDMTDLYINLRYTWQKQSMHYRIKIASKPSNLGKGTHYYFVCHRSFKCARKLYLHNGYFVHRTLIDACYFSQLIPPKERRSTAFYKWYFQRDEIHNQFYQKHYKRYYKGKPTKRYNKYLQFNLEPT